MVTLGLGVRVRGQTLLKIINTGGLTHYPLRGFYRFVTKRDPNNILQSALAHHESQRRIDEANISNSTFAS